MKNTLDIKLMKKCLKVTNERLRVCLPYVQRSRSYFQDNIAYTGCAKKLSSMNNNIFFKLVRMILKQV